MRNTYAWLFGFNTILHGLLLVAVLVIVWMGWRRHRRMGYLVLSGWAFCALGSTVVSMLLPFLHPWLRGLFPKLDSTLLMVLPSMGASFVAMLLMLAGLWLLVFRVEPVRPATPPPS